MENQPKSKLAQWLDNLQQESWQLELIVSGFAIFLLLATYEPIQDLRLQIFDLAAGSNTFFVLFFPYIILKGAWFVLVVNLILHVLLRGLWISTIGLRSVSEDIDFDSLRFQGRFDRFLRRIGSFDRYIERLEMICSVVFAFTFLIIFMIIAFGLFLAMLALISFILQKATGNPNSSVSNGILLFLFMGGLLYFVDFVALGRLKRVKWLARFYYPVYRFLGWITLAFLYRPIYYNLIDNRFGRRVGLFLVPYILLIMIVSSITFVVHTYFPNEADKLVLEKDYYDDTRDKRSTRGPASIPSKYLHNGFLELFLPYNPVNDDQSIEAICPGLEPARFTGMKLGGTINAGTIHNPKSKPDSLFFCMSKLHRIYINDSLFNQPSFHFYEHATRQHPGLLAILDVQYLNRGEHVLKVETQRLRKIDGRDSIVWREVAWIPFWKE